MGNKEEIDELKSRFFANISHEFRTPLTLILGQVEQLREAIAEQTLYPKLDTIERNASRLLDLINQVLELAKIEAGRLDMKMENRDIILFLSQMVQAFDPLVKQKKLQLNLIAEEKDFIMSFDAYKLERVIFNLISNAIKFTPEEGEVRVEFKVLDEKKHIEIKIIDTGIGIRPEKVPYIFDRFFQIKVEKTQTYTGTGIGLSLVKELIEMHNGEVNVTSKVGEGTTFIIYLPYLQNEGTATEEVHEIKLEPIKELSKQKFELPEASENKDSVLIVEDNAELRQYLLEELSKEGYNLSAAEDGEEGFIYAKNILPDLIISDVMMPFMDGYELAEALRSEERTSHIPIVLLTAKASESSKLHGLSIGVDDYLFKPFSSAELKVRVKNLIEQRKRLREKFKTATVIRPSEVSMNSVDQDFLGKVLKCIEENMANPLFGVDLLAEEAGMSVSHLNRKLNALIDQPGGQLIRSLRMQRAQELLEKNVGNISEIAYMIGYSNPTHFTRSFKKQFGYSPSEFKKRQA
ncbi:MAG: ATP-binding protein [Bacteroidia bacterium]|nr:ATP-binding protein [Bacteroidia bacterium]